MALKKNETFDIDDDQFLNENFDDLDFENFDSGGEGSKAKKIAKTVFSSLKAIGKGALNGALSSLGDNVKGFTEAQDTVKDTIEMTKNLSNDAVEDTKKMLKSAHRLAGTGLPMLRDVIPDNIYKTLDQKIVQTMEKREEEDTSEESRNEQYTNSLIEATLVDVFKKTQRGENLRFAMEAKERLIDRTVSGRYHAETLQAVGVVARHTNQISSFLRTTYMSYLKKDIELKYRSYFVSKENLAVTKSLGQLVESNLKAINEGVRMSDAQKIRTEREKNAPKKPAQAKNFLSGYMEKLKESIKAGTFGFMSDMTDMFDTGTEALGMFSDMPGIGGGNVKQTVANLGLGAGGWALGKWLMNKFTDKHLPFFNLLGEDLQGLVSGAGAKLNVMTKKTYNSGIMNFLTGFLPSFKRDTAVTNAAATNPTDPATFDNLTRESIISVIPAHLERIGDVMEGITRHFGISIGEESRKTYSLQERKLITTASQRKKVERILAGNDAERHQRAEQNKGEMIANILAKYKTDSIEEARKNPYAVKELDDLEASFPLINRVLSAAGYNNVDLDPDILRKFAENGADSETSRYITALLGGTGETEQNAARLLLTNITRNGKIDQTAIRNINRVIRRQADYHDKMAEAYKVIDDTGMGRFDPNIRYNLNGEPVLNRASMIGMIGDVGQRGDLEAYNPETGERVVKSADAVDREIALRSRMTARSVTGFQKTADAYREKFLKEARDTGIAAELGLTPEEMLAYAESSGLSTAAKLSPKAVATFLRARTFSLDDELQRKNLQHVVRHEKLEDAPDIFERMDRGLNTMTENAGKRLGLIRKKKLSYISQENANTFTIHYTDEKSGKYYSDRFTTKKSYRLPKGMSEPDMTYIQPIIDEIKKKAKYKDLDIPEGRKPNELFYFQSDNIQEGGFDQIYDDQKQYAASRESDYGPGTTTVSGGGPTIHVSRTVTPNTGTTSTTDIGVQLLTAIQNVGSDVTTIVSLLKNEEHETVSPIPEEVKAAAEEAAPATALPGPSRRRKVERRDRPSIPPQGDTPESIGSIVFTGEPESEFHADFRLFADKVLHALGNGGGGSGLPRHRGFFGRALGWAGDRFRDIRDSAGRGLTGARNLLFGNKDDDLLAQGYLRDNDGNWYDQSGRETTREAILKELKQKKASKQKGTGILAGIKGRISSAVDNIKTERLESRLDKGGYYNLGPDQWYDPNTGETYTAREAEEQLKNMSKEEPPMTSFQEKLLNLVNGIFTSSEKTAEETEKMAADPDIEGTESEQGSAAQQRAKREKEEAERKEKLSKRKAEDEANRQKKEEAKENGKSSKDNDDGKGGNGLLGSLGDKLLNMVLGKNAAKVLHGRGVKALTQRALIKFGGKNAARTLMTKGWTGLGKAALTSPAALATGLGALGGAIGLTGSKSSGAGVASNIFSTGAGATAGIAAALSNPVTAGIAAAALAGNAMREGWNDKKTLKASWGGENALDSQKGSSAVGNIANYLTFGLLNKYGGRKYVDKFADVSGIGHLVGGAGSQIAGTADIVKAGYRAFKGDNAAMNDDELRRARASLNANIKRGLPQAQEHLEEFELAVRKKDWKTARRLSNIKVNALRETTKGIKRIGKGMLAVATLGVSSRIESAFSNAKPMTEAELEEARRYIAAVKKLKRPGAKELEIKFEQAVEAEDWPVARRLGKQLRLQTRGGQLARKVLKGALLSNSITAPIGMLMSNQNEPLTDKEIKDFRDRCNEAIKAGNKNAETILEKFNDAVDLQEWRRARKISNIKDKSIAELIAPRARKILSTVVPLASMFDANQMEPLTESEITTFRTQMMNMVKQGDMTAKSVLDKFDDACLLQKWDVARRIASLPAQSTFQKNMTSLKNFFVGNQDKPLTEEEIQKFTESCQRKIEMGDIVAKQKLDAFNDAVSNMRWKVARDISEMKDTGVASKLGVGPMLMAKTSGLGIFLALDKASKPMKENEIEAFRERMNRLIETGSPQAKMQLDKFEDAVIDGNWKKARMLAGIEVRGGIGAASKGFINLFNDKIKEKPVDDKMTAEGDLPERYRLLLSKVKEALGKRTVDLINRFSLSRLRNEMQTTDIMELTEDKLNDWETRLRSYDRSVGDLSKAAVSEYEQERKGKSKLVTQQTNLLNEIIEAQKRTGIFEPGKRTKLKQLFKEVEAMDLDDLDEEMLAMYDTELRAIDSRAISTREFTPEQKKAMLEMMKRQTKLVSVIDLAKKELGWKHPMKQSQLNKLRSQVETAPVEELTEDDFSLWDEELKTIDPKAGSSVIRNAAEEKKLLELRKKKALLVTLVEKSRKKAKLFSDARSTLGKLLKEIDGTSDDDLSEEDISLWEDTYKSVDPKAVGLNEQMALDEAQAKVLKKRDELKKTIRKDIAKANRHKGKTTKDFIKGANSVIDLIDTKRSEEYTDQYHSWVESNYKNIQEKYPIGKPAKLEADHTPIAKRESPLDDKSKTSTVETEQFRKWLKDKKGMILSIRGESVVRDQYAVDANRSYDDMFSMLSKQEGLMVSQSKGAPSQASSPTIPAKIEAPKPIVKATPKGSGAPVVKDIKLPEITEESSETGSAHTFADDNERQYYIRAATWVWNEHFNEHRLSPKKVPITKLTQLGHDIQAVKNGAESSPYWDTVIQKVNAFREEQSGNMPFVWQKADIPASANMTPKTEAKSERPLSKPVLEGLNRRRHQPGTPKKAQETTDNTGKGSPYEYLHEVGTTAGTRYRYGNAGEKPKTLDFSGRTIKIRPGASGGNVIYSASPTRSDIQQGLENNRAEKAASEKLQKAQEERDTKAQATADNTSKGVQALGQITVQEVGVLQQILGEIRNVIGAVAESKAKTNATIEQTAVKSISIMKNYADGSFQQLAPVASQPLTREPAINIRKTL